MAYEKIKPIIEKLFKIKIYRNSLPFGVNMQTDLKRYFKDLRFKVVFDIGANVGQSAFEYLKLFPESEIYCFEPVDKTYNELKKNVELHSNIHTYKIGFGNEKSTLRISIHDDSRLNSLVDATRFENSENINITTLTEFVISEKIDRINFLKIDTEGFDLNVLKGGEDLLNKQIIDIIQVECNFHQSDVQVNIDEFLNYLKQFNYALFGIYEQQPSWIGDPWMVFANAVFVRKNILRS